MRVLSSKSPSTWNHLDSTSEQLHQKCMFPQRIRLASLIPSDLRYSLLRWSEARISIWKADSLPSCLSAHQLLTKNPPCNAPDARRSASLRRLTRERHSLRIFHIVRVIRFKTERRGGGIQPGENHKRRRKVRTESQRTTNPFSEISLFGNHETRSL